MYHDDASGGAGAGTTSATRPATTTSSTMNTQTPRLFIAATQQNDGKTTMALGLFAALRKKLGRIGFIKPVGQRFIDVEGLRVDEDSVLIDQTFGVYTPLEARLEVHKSELQSDS